MELIGTELLDETIGLAGAGSASIANGPLYQAQCRLFNADIPVDAATPLATLVAAEADYTGYAAGSSTFGGPFRADDGAIEMVSQQMSFRPTDAVTPNNIWGLFVTNAAGTNLLFVSRFDNPPVPMGSALDDIKVNLRWRPSTSGLVAVVS